MLQDSASFWSDIKMYEERLAQDPDSYLFARLAEIYLKVDLIDDALHIARRGVEKYPAYITGLRVLAMACYAKGLHDECRRALETVVAAIPEDAQVQRLLGKLLVADGNSEAAKKVLLTILDFNPDDLECREEILALEQVSILPVMESSEISLLEAGAELADSVVQEFVDDDEIIDLQESDIVEEFDLEKMAPPATTAERLDPLSTATLAELYVQQGFTDKALNIYRSVYAVDPTNSDVQTRIAELEAREAAAAAFPVMSDSADTISGTVSQESSVFPQGIHVQGATDDVVSTLEGWLENIRRIKACR